MTEITCRAASRRLSLLQIATASLLIHSVAADVLANRPNIVVIVADDLGWNAVGYHNPEFRTPHIDGLIREGVELDRFYVAPMCSPTRAGLMTGRYPIRFGLARAVIPPQRDFGLSLEETTLPEALQELGYRHRGVFGKWHLGHRRAKWHPINRGFTHFRGHYNGAIDYFDLTREGERDWHVNFSASSEQGYATDLIAQSSATWIREVAPDESPYFCYVPFNAPHSPFQAPPEDIERFQHLDEDRKPAGRRTRRNAPSKAVYAAMISRLDEGIGEILAAIEQSGESKNTIVWFLSDNGGVAGIRNNNSPLRGNKLTVYEGGIRVPAGIRWPGVLDAEGHCGVQMGYIDVFPTLIAAAGGDPESASRQPLDGRNVLPLLKVPTEASEQTVTRPWFSYHGQSGENAEHLSVHADGWKLKVNGPRLISETQLFDETNSVELFHLAADPAERNDLKAQHPDRVRALGRQAIQHRALQPDRSVPRYNVGKEGFVPPKNWQLNPEFPDRLAGTHEEQ